MPLIFFFCRNCLQAILWDCAKPDTVNDERLKLAQQLRWHRFWPHDGIGCGLLLLS